MRDFIEVFLAFLAGLAAAAGTQAVLVYNGVPPDQANGPATLALFAVGLGILNRKQIFKGGK